MRVTGRNHLTALQRALEEASVNARELGLSYREGRLEGAHLRGLEQRLGSLQRVQEQAQVYAQELARLYRHQRREARQVQEALRALERAYQDTLGALVAALDLRDTESSSHSARVAEGALALGNAVGLSSTDLTVLRRAALLHDVGKIGVSEAILRKPGPLAEEEWAQMREHPAMGRALLSRVAFLQREAEVVYAHHERWDGSGYPRGLAGEQIPRLARVFAVVDCLDAITSSRPYRCAQSLDQFYAEIRRGSGSQFDPAVVSICLDIPPQLWLELREQFQDRKELPGPQVSLN